MDAGGEALQAEARSPGGVRARGHDRRVVQIQVDLEPFERTPASVGGEQGNRGRGVPIDLARRIEREVDLGAADVHAQDSSGRGEQRVARILDVHRLDTLPGRGQSPLERTVGAGDELQAGSALPEASRDADAGNGAAQVVAELARDVHEAAATLGEDLREQWTGADPNLGGVGGRPRESKRRPVHPCSNEQRDERPRAPAKHGRERTRSAVRVDGPRTRRPFVAPPRTGRW